MYAWEKYRNNYFTRGKYPTASNIEIAENINTGRLKNHGFVPEM